MRYANGVKNKRACYDWGAFTHAAHNKKCVALLCIVRQLEQQVKSILDSIAVSEERKKELIRGDAVDKAEQLSKYFWLIIRIIIGIYIRQALKIATDLASVRCVLCAAVQISVTNVKIMP